MPEQTEKPKKILMIEDDMAMREIVIHKLMTHGFEVKEAEDGKKGIDMLIQEKPDLVLLDLMLPEVDGFKVLETVRSSQDAGLAKTPVIILSNLWSNKDILRTKALKVQAYMVKAYFTTEEILSKINEILKEGGQTVMEAPEPAPNKTTATSSPQPAENTPSSNIPAAPATPTAPPPAA